MQGCIRSIDFCNYYSHFGEQIRLQNVWKIDKNGPKVGSGGVLGALGSSWDALGFSGWVLGGILVDVRSFWESFLEPFSLKNRLCLASFFTYLFGELFRRF